MKLTGLLVALLAVAIVPHARAQADNAHTIAARFAPVFYQALGDKPRSDYITNFDFDGDWHGDNNWNNAADKKFPLRAYVYYSVSETATHYFIHYAVFHPRDYKGGEKRGRALSELIRQGSKTLGDRDPTGLMNEATLAHENDMEGALVVVVKNAKKRDWERVAFLETLHHNSFRLSAAGYLERSEFENFMTDEDRVLLYIEPRGHGIEPYTGDKKQIDGKSYLIYGYTGKAEDPEKAKARRIGYDLRPIQTTLWPKARAGAGEKATTYGLAHDYAKITISVAQPDGSISSKVIQLGGLGSAFLGGAGGKNMARPPWGWFDNTRREDALGLWFFDPATIVKRDFKLPDTFSTAYTRLPFWAL